MLFSLYGVDVGLGKKVTGFLEKIENFRKRRQLLTKSAIFVVQKVKIQYYIMASNFRQWTLAKVNKRFRLLRVAQHLLLDEWLAACFDMSDYDIHFLGKMQKHLANNIFSWNEQELSLHFIGPILSWVDFTTDYSNIFEERAFEAEIDGETISGAPDAIIASGKDEPEQPYFCLQEYKKETDPNGDPYGQCIVAMLAAQSLNENQLPIYGVIVVGENWRFVVLKGSEYAISSPYSATTNEVYDIYHKLVWLKNYVIAQVSSNHAQIDAM